MPAAVQVSAATVTERGASRTGQPVSLRVVDVPDAGEAVLRWKLGHQLFHLHLAAMNTLLVDARDWA